MKPSDISAKNGINNTTPEDPQAAGNDNRCNKSEPRGNDNNDNGYLLSSPVTGTKKSPPLTREEVFEACNKIEAQGNTPTIRLVYKVVRHGSNSTVQKFLAEYLNERQKQTVNAIDDSKQPPKMVEELTNQAVQIMVNAKIEESDSKIRKLKDVIAQITIDANNEKAQLAEAIDKVNADLTDESQKRKAAEDENRQLHSELANLESANNALQHSYEKLQKENELLSGIKELLRALKIDPDWVKEILSQKLIENIKEGEKEDL